MQDALQYVTYVGNARLHLHLTQAILWYVHSVGWWSFGSREMFVEFFFLGYHVVLWK